MTQQEIVQRLTAAHQEFAHSIEVLSATSFVAARHDKWSAGQQLEHILRSVTPVATALGMPKFVLRLLFRRANRPSRTYEDLVARYQQRLAAGGRATGRFVPGPVQASQQAVLCHKLSVAVAQLVKRAANYSEPQLDSYVLPHPLLGKLTLREMLYFTLYHVQHHQRLMLANLSLGPTL